MSEKETNPYLIEVYKQASENARMYAKSRFSNLSAFLTYMSVITAAVALSYSNRNSTSVFKNASLLISALGLIVSILFLALEIRHHYYWEYYELKVVKGLEKKMGFSQYPENLNGSGKRDWIKKGVMGISATKATYGIYVTSMMFFVFMIIASF
jgi:hypothetical protein